MNTVADDFGSMVFDDRVIREATERRGLLNHRTTANCMPHLLDRKNVDMLTSHGVFTVAELRSRYAIMLENYCKTLIIEANTMVDMAKTQIAPAIKAYAADVARAAAAKKALDPALSCNCEAGVVRRLSALTDQIAVKAEEVAETVIALNRAENIGAESVMIRDRVLPLMAGLRLACDGAETLPARSRWPFPSYADLLFGVK